MSPKSLANLMPPAKPGEVRNPRGINRKSKTLSQAYKFRLGDDVPNDPQKRTFAELLADAMVYKAAKVTFTQQVR